MDIVDEIISYENGEMTQEEGIAFFQKIIDNGMVWTLQGFYGRTAERLIEAGHCQPKS